MHLSLVVEDGSKWFPLKSLKKTCEHFLSISENFCKFCTLRNTEKVEKRILLSWDIAKATERFWRENVNKVIKETIVRYFGFKVRDSSASSDRLRSNPRANESEKNCHKSRSYIFDFDIFLDEMCLFVNCIRMPPGRDPSINSVTIK